MPFCTSCGKEAPSGKKFCEYCGAPLEQPPAAPFVPAAVAAAPASPPVIPGKPAAGSGKAPLVAGVVVVLILIAVVYFIGLPMLSGSQGTGSDNLKVTTVPTRVPTVVPVTTFTATTSGPEITGIPAAGQTYEDRYMETYNQVSSVNQAFAGGQKVIYNQVLIAPPLYIKFNITPKMYYDERPVEIGTHNEHIANISYPSPDAWFKVRVYDTDDGSLVDEQGFNKEHSVMTKQEFMVRKPGNYRVEMSGNDVTADVRILTGKS